MKRIALILSLTGFVFTSCNNETKTEAAKTDTTSTDKTATSTELPAPPMDSAAMAKAWENFMTPGEMHKWMASHAGTWEADVSSYMGGPEPTKSKATEVVKMTMNGLYQLANMKGTMMGMPFEGQSTMAYDNAKKQFVLTWIDNMGSGIIMMTGQYDAATKTMHFKGTQTDPATGKDANIRQEQKFVDDDNYVLTMFGAGPDGKETKFMEGTFKRVKK